MDPLALPDRLAAELVDMEVSFSKVALVVVIGALVGSAVLKMRQRRRMADEGVEEAAVKT